VIGAFFGNWLLPALGLHLGSGIISATTDATIGALILLLIMRLVRGGNGWRARGAGVDDCRTRSRRQCVAALEANASDRERIQRQLATAIHDADSNNSHRPLSMSCRSLSGLPLPVLSPGRVRSQLLTSAKNTTDAICTAVIREYQTARCRGPLSSAFKSIFTKLLHHRASNSAACMV
jgi:hypothetical protein